jgi:hypothetical protein
LVEDVVAVTAPFGSKKIVRGHRDWVLKMHALGLVEVSYRLLFSLSLLFKKLAGLVFHFMFVCTQKSVPTLSSNNYSMTKNVKTAKFANFY